MLWDAKEAGKPMKLIQKFVSAFYYYCLYLKGFSFLVGDNFHFRITGRQSLVLLQLKRQHFLLKIETTASICTLLAKKIFH